MKIMLLLCFILCFDVALSQQVRVVTNERNAIVKLDTSRIEQFLFHPLSPGRHIIQYWAPTRMLMTDTIQVNGDTNIYINKKLPFTPEFLTYKKDMREYTLKKKGPIYLTAVVTLAAVASHFVYKQKIDDELDAANAAKDKFDYSISTEDLLLYRLEYESHHGSYESLRETNNAIKTASAVLLAAGIYGIIRYSKLKRPHYEETPLLSDFMFYFNNNNFSEPQATLQWKF